MNLVFATCDHQPLTTPDDQVLADALAARGVAVTPIPWTEINPFADFDAPPILLRSTWDYHRVPTMFSSWLAALETSGRAMWNPPGIARGNVDKIYLKDLEAAGISIPKTKWVDSADPASLEHVLGALGWDRAVLKPRIAATAYGTFVVERGTPIASDDLAPARASGALLQELIPEVVERGEVSLIYMGGAFSHAVLKRARSGEFRVQKDFGGHVEVTTPSQDVLAFAGRVMTTVPPSCLYARVDLVETSRGPLLMELELIEPELYFLLAPEAANRMAELIIPRLS